MIEYKLVCRSCGDDCDNLYRRNEFGFVQYYCCNCIVATEDRLSHLPLCCKCEAYNDKKWDMIINAKN